MRTKSIIINNGPRSRHTTPSIFVTICIIIAFFSGILFSTIIKSPQSPFTSSLFPTNSSSHTATAARNSTTLATGAQNVSTVVGPQQIPLALQWFHQSLDNPWSFSTQRTTNDMLYDALTLTLKRDGNLPRVAVSFTSLPKRFIKHGLPLIRLLKRQNYLPDVIYANIPKTSRRSDDDFVIPKWILNDPLIKVLRPETDYGPATKLIPALQEEIRLGNMDTRIVTVDDDNEGNWRDGSLLELLAHSLVFTDKAIGLTGWNVTCMVRAARCDPEDSGSPPGQFMDRFYHFIKQSDDYACHSLSDWRENYFRHCMGAVRKTYIAYVDVIEGYKGALYQPKFFDMKMVESIIDKTKTPDYFFWADDVWFGGCLSLRGIDRIVINPAFSDGDKIRMKLIKLSDKRNLSRTVPENAGALASKPIEVEKGLHELSKDFTKGNHDGVRWFESKGAWTKGMWDRPEGFRYPSEREEEVTEKEDEDGVIDEEDINDDEKALREKKER